MSAGVIGGPIGIDECIVAAAALVNSSKDKTMQFRPARNLLLTALLSCALPEGAALAASPQVADAAATRNALLTGAGEEIPPGAFGVLRIERPREVTLLHLRGIGGRGDVILRSGEPGDCLSIPVRFVAGDFGGDTIAGHLADPIQLLIRSRRTARALAKGHDVVSDTYRVSASLDRDADIVLQSGLDESFGFVINPGRNIIADIFGLEPARIPCRRVRPAEPGM
jgi:hypothetical protein